MNTKYKEGWFLPDKDIYFEQALLHYPMEDNGKRIYQYQHLDRCFHYLSDSKKRIAIDIGAHVGFWSYYLCKNFSHVHSFEPLDMHIECFKKNITATNNSLHEVGISNKNEKVSFDIPEDISGKSSVNPNKKGNINLFTLDSFDFKEVDFIKIDVEGYEKFVIQGSIKTILKNKPILIVEEKTNSSKYNVDRYSAVEELKKIGAIILERVVDDFIMGWP